MQKILSTSALVLLIMNCTVKMSYRAYRYQFRSVVSSRTVVASFVRQFSDACLRLCYALLYKGDLHALENHLRSLSNIMSRIDGKQSS